MRGKKIASIKSEKALSYLDAFNLQCPRLTTLIAVDVEVRMRIIYASRRPDLDESLILDALQGKAYLNDRQVKRKVIDWGLDPDNPRTEIEVYPFETGYSAGDKGHRKGNATAKKRRGALAGFA